MMAHFSSITYGGITKLNNQLKSYIISEIEMENKMRKKIIFIVIFSVLLSSCNIGVTPPASETESTPQPTRQPTEAQSSTPTDTSTPELVTIDLAGPPMEVGSRYTYVDGAILVAVPGGPFTMGYNFADNPVREVTVSDFWIYSAKVTNQQYALCVQAGKCSAPDPEKNPDFGQYRYINFPVTGVTYAQATDYCSFVKGRLPTEAEWEKTARGPEGNIFPWGDEAPKCSLLNYIFCKGRTTYINEYEDGISYYGAFDMSGNVREWAADWYSPSYNVDSPVPNPLGPEFGEKRSVRGSGFQDSANATIAAHRFSLDPLESLPDLGFRCVVEDPTYFAPWCEQLAYFGKGPNGEEANCTPSVLCNDVSISQGLACNEQIYVPYTIVTVKVSNTPPDGWSYNVPGCSAIPGEQTATQDKFLCNPGAVGPAEATGTCIEGASCVSTCPPHYNKVGDVCVWDGSGTTGTACLPGSTYDPLTQCCTSEPGSAVNFNLCPAGFYPLDGACIPNPSAVVDSVVQSVLFDKCSPPVTDVPGDDDDCPITSANQCSYPYAWDGKCSCYCPFTDPRQCTGYSP
jgi:formylglycine-generating enzyme required for sulfatase activity